MSWKIVASTILACVLMQVGVAHAQVSSSDAAIAQSLFDEGRKLMAEKKYKEACPRLERSYKLDPAAGTLLNLAVCHEAVNKTATAWDEFRESVTIARRENREERMKFAQSHVDALKDRLCTLTVKQAVQESGLEWKLDGANMGIESLGVALAIDPGSHVVEAKAPGKKPWKTEFEVHKDAETKAIEIPVLVVLPPEELAKEKKGLSPWLFVAGGVGVVGLGMLAVGGIEALSEWNVRTKNCGIGGDPNACSQLGMDADKQARTWAVVADVGLGVGIAGTVATIIIAAVGHPKPKEAPPPAKISLSPTLTPYSAGLSLGGVF